MNAAIELLDDALAPVRKWISDPDTEELVVNKPGEAFVLQHGVWTRHDIQMGFRDLYAAATLSGALRRQNVGTLGPLLGGELPSGERFQWVVPDAVPAGTVSLTIRKPGSRVSPIEDMPSRYATSGWNKWSGRKEIAKRQHADLIALYDAGDLIAFLRAAVRARLNIWLTGATGSGKTTALKTLVALIDTRERLITVEDALELVVPQPNHVRLLYSPSYQSGEGIGPDALLKATLRMRPDRVILGELRDPAAAWTYVNSVNTGHPGSITSIHGGDPAQAFTRLANLCSGTDEGRTFDDDKLVSLLSNAVDVIIPFDRSTGAFTVKEVWYVGDAERRGETAANLLLH